MIKLNKEDIQKQAKENYKSLKRWLTSTETGKQCLAFIILPMLLVTLYLVVLSPSRYVSSATVLIKEAGVAQIQEGLLEGLGIDAGGSSKDEQLLQAYVTSPNLLNELDKQLAIKEHYSKSWDYIFGLSRQDSYEDFLKFYRKYTKVEPDNSGLLAISVQAYSPEFAKKLADALLESSERFINEASQMIARREMQFALDEINRSQGLLKDAKNALLEFQNEHNLISPDSEGESLVGIVFELEGELAKTEATISQTESYLNPSAPQIVALKNKAKALKKEIEAQKQRVIGATQNGDKLNELGAKFQELNLDLELATTLYTSALSAYELARVQAGKQLKHLVVASKPQLPEEALYPERLYWFITCSIFLGLFWGIVRMVLMASKEHKD